MGTVAAAQHGALADGVTDHAPEHVGAGLARKVDAGEVGLDHHPVPRSLQVGDVLQRGGGVVRAIAGRQPSAGGDRRLDHDVPTGRQRDPVEQVGADGVAGPHPSRRHDGDAGVLQIPQVALVGVPRQDRMGVGQGRGGGHAGGPRQELVTAIDVVGARSDQGAVEQGPVDLGPPRHGDAFDTHRRQRRQEERPVAA